MVYRFFPMGVRTEAFIIRFPQQISQVGCSFRQRVGLRTGTQGREVASDSQLYTPGAKGAGSWNWAIAFVIPRREATRNLLCNGPVI